MAAPPNESNGYLRVRCNGGLNQQRTAVCILVLKCDVLHLCSCLLSDGGFFMRAWQLSYEYKKQFIVSGY